MNTRVEIPETRKIILSVNDSATMDRNLSDWLHKRGAVLLRAASTEYALALLEKAQVDLVISDLGRQEGGTFNPKAGMELAMKIRQLGSPVPMVIYTMNKGAQIHKLAIDAGANYVTEQQRDLMAWLEKLGI